MYLLYRHYNKVTGEEIVKSIVLQLKETSQIFTFDNIDNKPVVSILRGFSAPVIYITSYIVYYVYLVNGVIIVIIIMI